MLFLKKKKYLMHSNCHANPIMPNEDLIDSHPKSAMPVLSVYSLGLDQNHGTN